MSFLPSWLTGTSGYQDEDDAAARIDAEEAALREQAKRNGTEEKTEKFISAVGGAESVQNAYLSGFGEGLNDGKNNINSAFWSGIGNALKLVPTPVWIAAGVGVFLYLGGGVWALKKTKGVLAQ
jgi:hypothetical protein